MDRETEAALWRAAGAGDGRAIEAIYQAHVDGLWAFVYYRVGRDDALAEDVVHDTLAQALQRADRFDPERGPLATWLKGLARNVIRTHIRRRRDLEARWERVDDDLREVFEQLDAVPLSDEVLSRRQTSDLVSMTLSNLPDRYQAALEARYLREATTSELAESLHVTENAVRSLLKRARHAFKDAFLTLMNASGPDAVEVE